jgi:hypothetical protein
MAIWEATRVLHSFGSLGSSDSPAVASSLIMKVRMLSRLFLYSSSSATVVQDLSGLNRSIF